MCEGTRDRERLRDLRTKVLSFARAAVAQEHRLCGSNNRDDDISQFWRLHVQEQVVSRVGSFERQQTLSMLLSLGCRGLSSRFVFKPPSL